jgi:hypothetical protein
MEDSRYFAQRAKDYAAAARETSDRWYALRFSELAAHFAAMARQAALGAGERRDTHSTA